MCLDDLGQQSQTDGSGLKDWEGEEASQTAESNQSEIGREELTNTDQSGRMG